MLKPIRVPSCVAAGLFLGSAALSAQTYSKPSQELLAGITERGRRLAAYDAAAWQATDAFLELEANTDSLRLFIATERPDGWLVSFGWLNAARDTFFIGYEAIPAADPSGYRVVAHATPRSDTGAVRRAAAAVQLAIEDFGPVQRRYNPAVLPAPDGRHWVYLMPAQTQPGIFPHGGDVRYLISPDGRRIEEKRQLHRSILELEWPEKATAGMHSAVMDDVPEDTDVFYVLARQPRMKEFIVTEHYYYQVNEDGSIVWDERDR